MPIEYTDALLGSQYLFYRKPYINPKVFPINAVYSSKRVIPSHFEICFSIVTKVYRIVTTTKIGIVVVMKLLGICKSPNIDEIPITPNALKIFDPVIFPIAISLFPFLAAVAETANSGRDVPIAIAEIAMRSVPILRNSAIFTTDSIV